MNAFEPLSHRPPRVGVLGASRIVQAALLNEASGMVDVVAVAARDLGRAQSYAVQHGIPRALGSYEELILDPSIDCIYNALPAAGHAPWTQRALEAGKHVLCEKPFGLHVDEARACVAVARQCQRLLMEAHHWRYHPLIGAAELALAALAQTGDPVSIEAQFVGGLNNPGDIRLNPALGPGVLMDFGCYTIQWSVWMAECLSWGARGVRVQLAGDAAEAFPSVRSARLTEGAAGIDLAAKVELEFSPLPSGPLAATFECDMRDGMPFRAFVRAQAGDDFVHFENPLGIDGSFLITRTPAGEVRTDAKGPTTYGGQLHAFVEALASGEPPLTSGDNIISTQALLDDCYERAGLISRRALRERSLLSARD